MLKTVDHRKISFIFSLNSRFIIGKAYNFSYKFILHNSSLQSTHRILEAQQLNFLNQVKMMWIKFCLKVIAYLMIHKSLLFDWRQLNLFIWSIILLYLVITRAMCQTFTNLHYTFWIFFWISIFRCKGEMNLKRYQRLWRVRCYWLIFLLFLLQLVWLVFQYSKCCFKGWRKLFYRKKSIDYQILHLSFFSSSRNFELFIYILPLSFYLRPWDIYIGIRWFSYL